MQRTTTIVLSMFMAVVTTACGGSETPSQPAQTQAPAAAPVPAQPATSMKEIQQQRAGEYVVALLNDTGDLKQGANNVTLEFRRASDNQLADVGNVQVENMMEMKGMGPMMAKTNVTPSGTPGRYNVTSELSMAGDWKMAVTFAGQKAEFNLAAK